MTKKKGVPDGWLPVSAIGKPISGTKFLAFKVPLKETLCNNLEPDDRFSPAILLEKEPNLRLVIDLTNTKRYYDKNEFLQNGVNYEKIFCPGREIPGRHLMRQFFNVVDNFMQSEDTEDKFIGVHCTHGINRTGYFICTYMIQKLGFTPDKAISTFQEARGHEIVRDYIIKELKKDKTKKHGKDPQKHSSSSGKYRNSPHKPFNHGSRGGPSRSPGPSGSHNRGRHRVSHYSSRPPPPPEQRGPRPKDSFAQQSQLNYYEEENSGYSRFNWRRENFRGRPQSHSSKNPNS